MRSLLSSLIILLSFNSPAIGQQDSSAYHPPLGIDPRLAGNFGELRPGHFHTGVDLKTKGRRGLSIKAIERGYISRIKIQEGGYGKALYVDHPDGNTSVYAHLKQFAPAIEQFLRQIQHKHQRGPLDLYPGEGMLPVEKGEIIGQSGNSGSSSAPHLHFEIRNTASEDPIDPLLFDFGISDRRPPRFHGVKIDWESAKGKKGRKVLPTRKVSNGEYRPSTGGQVRIPPSKELKIAVRSTDQASGTHNPLGIQLLELYVDQELRYSARFDTLDFSKNGYINAHIDHPYLHEASLKYHRCYVLPNNQLEIYGKKNRARGTLHQVTDKGRRVRITAYDREGNRSTLRFRLSPSEPDPGSKPPEEGPGERIQCRWNERTQYRTEGFEMTILPRTLYQDHQITVDPDSLRSSKTLVPNHQVHDASVPVHDSFLVRMELDTIPPGAEGKLFIISKDDRWGEKAYKAELEDGWAKGAVKRFGELSVRVDSIAPNIRPVKTREQVPSKSREQFRFHLSDDLSGIDSYDAFIGSAWCIPYYDSKNGIIKVKVGDPYRSLSPGDKKFILRVRDRAGNQRSFIKEVTVK